MTLAEWLDWNVFPGLSLFFVLLFFGPLLVAVLVPLLFVRQRLRLWIRGLTILWLVACAFAGMMITMGYAFNPKGWNPILQIALWVLAGLAIIRLPLAAKARWIESRRAA